MKKKNQKNVANLYFLYNIFLDYKIGDAFGAKLQFIQHAEGVSSNIVP